MVESGSSQNSFSFGFICGANSLRELKRFFSVWQNSPNSKKKDEMSMIPFFFLFFSFQTLSSRSNRMRPIYLHLLRPLDALPLRHAWARNSTPVPAPPSMPTPSSTPSALAQSSGDYMALPPPSLPPSLHVPPCTAVEAAPPPRLAIVAPSGGRPDASARAPP